MEARSRRGRDGHLRTHALHHDRPDAFPISLVFPNLRAPIERPLKYRWKIGLVVRRPPQPKLTLARAQSTDLPIQHALPATRGPGQHRLRGGSERAIASAHFAPLGITPRQAHDRPQAPVTALKRSRRSPNPQHWLALPDFFHLSRARAAQTALHNPEPPMNRASRATPEQPRRLGQQPDRLYPSFIFGVVSFGSLVPIR